MRYAQRIFSKMLQSSKVIAEDDSSRGFEHKLL